MAVCTIRSMGSLDDGLILAPERYHPGRELYFNNDISYMYLSDLVTISGKSVSPSSVNLFKNLYVLDTGDVHEGRIIGNKPFSKSINSSKKIIKPGDVIISRLRPYLRQIAYVDNYLPRITDSNVCYLCSTEFYVLSSIDRSSIAFLIPFLLSESVQNVFSNAIEGGQHPRFNQDVLMSLRIPKTIVMNREQLSKQVTTAINQFRTYEKEIASSIEYIDESLSAL